jgi:hypothetical protein
MKCVDIYTYMNVYIYIFIRNVVKGHDALLNMLNREILNYIEVYQMTYSYLQNKIFSNAPKIRQRKCTFQNLALISYA